MEVTVGPPAVTVRPLVVTLGPLVVTVVLVLEGLMVDSCSPLVRILVFTNSPHWSLKLSAKQRVLAVSLTAIFRAVTSSVSYPVIHLSILSVHVCTLFLAHSSAPASMSVDNVPPRLTRSWIIREPFSSSEPSDQPSSFSRHFSLTILESNLRIKLSTE